jgi:hypothetical protein
MELKTMKSEACATGVLRERDTFGHVLSGSLVERQSLGYMLLLVCTLVFLAHLPALSARAIFHDDTQYVLENPLVQNPSLHSAARFFREVWRPSTVPGYYQPLTMVSLMVDRFLAGRYESIRAYHRTSLLFHVANSALVGVFLYMLFGKALVAAGIAFLFGVHPISVESVCWIAERKTVLATFFALWSLIAYVRFTREGKRRFYVASIALYILGLLSKPITVPLPAMMLLLDYWPLDRLRRRAIVEKLPLFAIAGFFSVVAYVSQSRTTPVFLPGDYNPARIPLILCHNIIFYLAKLFWPVNLSAHYAYTTRTAMVAGVAGTCLLIPVLILSLRRTRAALTGWSIFFVMVFPTMGIISVTPVIAANRYLYLPAIGILLVLAALLGRASGLASGWIGAKGYAVAAAMLLSVAGIETAALRAYLARWADDVSLHEYLLTITPRSAILQSDLGAALSAAGRTEDAIRHYRQAVTLQPYGALSRYNLAVELAKSPQTIDEGCRRVPAGSDARSGLGKSPYKPDRDTALPGRSEGSPQPL